MAAGPFSDGERCIVTATLQGTEYAGEATWTDNNGFNAKLFGYFSGKFMTFDAIPNLLPIEIGRGRRALLVDPRITSLGGMTLAVGRPAVTPLEIASNVIVHDLPWDLPDNLEIEKISVESEALRLWYGDKTANINENYETKKTVAKFSVRSEEFSTTLGKLSINVGYKSPGWPRHGNYEFSTLVESILCFTTPCRINKILYYSDIIDGFFDILSAFPKKKRRVSVLISGFDKFSPTNCSISFLNGAPDSNFYNVFISKSDRIDLGKSLSEFFSKYDEIKILYLTVRYLSSSQMVVPEGFLTACNLLEAIGEDGAKPNLELSEAIHRMAELVEKNKEYKDFWTIVDRSLLKSPSFKARYESATSRLKSIGIFPSLSGAKVRDVRAAYRHNLRAIKQDDLHVMRAFVGMAWFIGLIELAKLLRIDDKIIKRSANRELFHVSRGTNIPLWSKPFADQRKRQRK